MSNPNFTAAWLLLLPVLAFLAWRCPRLRLLRPARAITLLALILLLCDPRFPTRRGGMDLWVLLDRSASTGDIVNRGSQEWRNLLEKARPSGRDRIHYIDFAEDALPAIDGGGTELPPSSQSQTRTARAIDTVLARQDSKRPTRLLLFTDGYATEPLGDVASRLAAEGVPLDFRLIQTTGTLDFRITGIEAPSRVQPGEAFLIRARVAVTGSKADTTVPIMLMRDGKAISENTIPLRDGVATMEWADRLNQQGAHQYEVIIRPPQDAHPGNNRASTWIETASGPRILVISKHPDDPLAAAFAAQGLQTELITDPAAATPSMLTGARAVVINNIPSHDFSPGFLASLDFFIRQQAGGLMMTGGRFAFGAGGYFQSPIDELLPVSMELKADQRKLALAMAIVLDRSGSMMASADGPPGTTKMDLANNGTATAVELLGIQDMVAVFAVDSSAHSVVPLTNVGPNRKKITGRIRSIESSGGGIFVYEGLKAGWEELKKADVGTRHLILFADANDSEEPGQYRRLLKEMTDAGTTISVVGLGTNKDADANLLIEIARLGNGRMHFCENARDIPSVFAGETVAVARSAFIPEATNLLATGEWSELSSLPIEWPASVDGYNLSYARPGAAVTAITTDEYAAPLVAAIRRGLGRTAAVSFPMSGEHSERIRQWPGYNGFTRTLGRWLVGEPIPPGIGLRHQIQGNRLTLDLHYDPLRWNQTIAATPPKLFATRGQEQPEAFEITWARLAPGHFSASFDLHENDLLRGVVQIGDHALPFGPLSVPVSAEWAFDPARLADLRLASHLSQGVERTDLSTAWQRPPVVQYSNLRLPLAILTLVMMIYDAFATKTGMRFALPSFQRLPKTSRRKPQQAAAPATILKEATAEPKEAPAPAPPPVPDESETRRKRFQDAKRMRGE